MTDSQFERGAPRSLFTATLLTTYLAGAFLTFGHVYNANYIPPARDCGSEPNILENEAAWDDWYWCENPHFVNTAFGAGHPATLAGLVWPVYWAGRSAIWITAPAEPQGLDAELVEEINKALAAEGMTGVTVKQ